MSFIWEEAECVRDGMGWDGMGWDGIGRGDGRGKDRAEYTTSKHIKI